MSRFRVFAARVRKALAIILIRPSALAYMRTIKRRRAFDPTFYRRSNPGLYRLFRLFPLRHYVLWGERAGLQPNAKFSPEAYLELHPDIALSGMPALYHFLTLGQGEGRQTLRLESEALPSFAPPPLRFDPARKKKRFALHLHIYYPDLWTEFTARLRSIEVDTDIYVTLTWRGEQTKWLADEIAEVLPHATIIPMANKGRDILPFFRLINADAFEGYEAVCKIHTKKSPHRDDGADWRERLVTGILPRAGLSHRLNRFIADPAAAFWVADGQSLPVSDWWGSNRDKTAAALRRIEMDIPGGDLRFPAGSMYWAKPLMIGLMRSLRLTDEMFEAEQGQVDGTLAHAVERGIGALALAAGQSIRETASLIPTIPSAPATPRYVSAFYLPQFHPIPENDRWWGKGFTEWRGVSDAKSAFPGHLQPQRPADLGYYDLRATEVMSDQAALAQSAGIDAFCVYHYWFGGKRLLEAPLNGILARPEIDFPFYLCWANESWRRNWDGLSGETLMEQAYAPGFEAALVASTLPYMRDPRYQRPDGLRPRFVIYRPEDMPAPAQNVARLRRAWVQAGIGPVELGAVGFHVGGDSVVERGLFDFHIEMPPHGLVEAASYDFGGPAGNLMGDAGPADGFAGLIYDYNKVAERSLTPRYRRRLPEHTIAGIMPGWDNTARRGARAHIARGANPASFRHWLRRLQETSLETSYRGELFINAWNEWAEKAVMEPTEVFGRLNLDVLAEVTLANRPAATQELKRHG